MKAAVIIMLFYALICTASICMIALLVQKPEPIPCGIMEISPDFSTADREYCRRHRQSLSKHFL